MARDRGSRSQHRSTHGKTEGGAVWLYGLHAVRAALENPRRKVRRALVTERIAEELRAPLTKLKPEIYAPDAMARLLPQGAVHQGAALLCEPLPPLDLEDALSERPPGSRIVAVLDQVTDPHN